MEKERSLLKAYATCLIYSLLIVTLAVMGIKLKSTQDRLTQLEEGTSERMAGQQKQLDSLSLDIEDLWNNADEVSRDIEKLGKDLGETKQIQRNTNKALIRLKKRQEQFEEKIKEELESRKERMMASGSSWSAMGAFILTAYEWTGNPCANGCMPTVGYTCASNYFPLGTRLYIEGIGERVVEDTGGMALNVIDIYLGDIEACYQFGVQSAQVQVIDN